MKRICLDGAWSARIDPRNEGLAAGWAAERLAGDLLVPAPGCIQRLDALAGEYPPEAGMRNGYSGTWFMETECEIETLDSERVYWFAEGAAPACHLFVNGRFASRHQDTLCPWRADITDLVRKGKNRLTVAVTEDYCLMYAGSRFFGVNWSGIYGHVFLEMGGAIRLEGLCLTEAGICGWAVNDGKRAWQGSVHAAACGAEGECHLALAAGAEEEFFLPLDTAAFPRWFCDAPELIDLVLTWDREEKVFRTGLRTIKTRDGRIYMNGRPLFLAGAGEEFYSLDISPLQDETLIRQRLSALKAFGFNFYRYHTHAPTETEMRLADEMGILLDAELGLVSNFHKTLPVDDGFKMLEKYVRATRNHPSLLVYCLGNEGSQLMVVSQVERNKARIGYEMIKRNTPNQLAITCFGNQGELPELMNDIETPHLWSDNFLAAYAGLTDIPWKLLAGTTLGRPCVVHEYGKFGVWPDVRDEELSNQHGVRKEFGTAARNALIRAGMADKEQAFLEHSRRLCSLLSRVILEEARRQPYISGYALWSFFRGGARNTGLCDDTGVRFDCDPRLFREGCNAPVALLMDRGFKRRAIACGRREETSITLSNFTPDEIGQELTVSLLDGESVIACQRAAVSAAPGETRAVMRFAFSAPPEAHMHRLTLRAEMACARNEWDFWAFDCGDAAQTVLMYVREEETEAQLRRIFPEAVRLRDADSIRIGCRSWTNPALADTAAALGGVVIADRWDAVIQACAQRGACVLLIDTGALPAPWYCPAVYPELEERDTGRFFSSFRGGWSKGNLLTCIEADALLGDYPQEGFCDLQFYAMLQGALTLDSSRVAADIPGLRDVIYGIAHIPGEAAAEAVVQDPNAIREQKKAAEAFAFRKQSYLLAGERLAITTMKLTHDPAGIGMLRQLAEHLAKA